ncbi:hypothetical protein RCJ22_27215 [Vibrio sp. FNV 38]|nr:hypothetical protein [Vibrio sp. FNV 38]
MTHSKTKAALGLALCASFSAGVLADENTVHDADPRNTAFRGGITADDSGEVRLVTGGGFNNLYGDGEYQTQTIVIAEYFTQSENIRLRLANFDERFGGVYTDLYFTDYMNMYTGGYMLPLTATNNKTLLFPSVNYSYIDFDTKEMTKDCGVNLECAIPPSPSSNAISSMGYSTGSLSGEDLYKHLLGGDDDAHMFSVNLYGLQPWNDTFYTVFQAFSGSTYGGVEMEMVDIVLLQGTRTKVGEGVFNIYVEGKYTNIKLDELNTSKGYFRGEDAKVSIGFDWRF